MRTSDDIKDLATALSAAQGDMKNAPLNKVNPHFKSKYADLAGIRDATVPILANHGLTITQFTTFDGCSLVLCTRLLHKSGQWMEGEYPLPTNLDKPQQMGSALTYARRYSWSAACGIAAEEDDDGNAAQQANGGGDSQKSASPKNGHPNDLGTTAYKAALRVFEQERIGILHALRGGEITAQEANDRYREIRDGTLFYSVNSSEGKVATTALLEQCRRSPEWHDNPKDGWQGFVTRLRETREELDRALKKVADAGMPDDPFAPDSQEEAAE